MYVTYVCMYVRMYVSGTDLMQHCTNACKSEWQRLLVRVETLTSTSNSIHEISKYKAKLCRYMLRQLINCSALSYYFNTIFNIQ